MSRFPFLEARAVRALLLLGVAALAGGAGCAGQATDASALEAQLRGLIGDAACVSDDQCRTVAFGAKACGGPQGYLAWSTLHTDATALAATAEQYAARRRADNQREGRVSDCAMVADPGAYCAPAPSGAAGQRACRLGVAGRAVR